MAVAICSPVELGFVEDVDDKSEFPFPSHVGGKPHWINPKQLPDCGILTCKECRQPLLLLLQLFVPLRDANSSVHAYHRMIYVFTCIKASCHRAGPSDPGMVVLRTQLPRENLYYPPDVDIDEPTRENPCSNRKFALEEPEPDENTSCLTSVPKDVEKEPESTQRQFFSMSVFESHLPSLCAVCGGPGNKRCGGCHWRNYCSKSHQIHHWKSGHQLECSSDKREGLKGKVIDAESILFRKMDLVTEPEPAEIENEQGGRTEEERMKEYKKFIQSAVYKKQSVDSADELSVIGHTQDVDPDVRDKRYKHFRERMQREPEQVCSVCADSLYFTHI